jgi:hypothetical protein
MQKLITLYLQLSCQKGSLPAEAPFKGESFCGGIPSFTKITFTIINKNAEKRIAGSGARAAYV